MHIRGVTHKSHGYTPHMGRHSPFEKLQGQIPKGNKTQILKKYTANPKNVLRASL